jgi:hypothetical protein
MSFIVHPIKFIIKSLSNKSYKCVLRALSTPETPGYKWLLLFKPQYHSNLAFLLGPGPTVKQVIELYWFNRSHDILIEERVKFIRFDVGKLFDIELEQSWGDVSEGCMSSMMALQHAGECYKSYQFI